MLQIGKTESRKGFIAPNAYRTNKEADSGNYYVLGMYTSATNLSFLIFSLVPRPPSASIPFLTFEDAQDFLSNFIASEWITQLSIWYI